MTHSDHVVAMETVSDERLAEILAGLEGVTPGPWEPARDYAFQTDPLSILQPVSASANGGHKIANFYGPDREANAKTFASLDPATVRSIISELIASRLAKQAQDGWVLVPKEDLEGMADDGHAWAQAMLENRCFICDLSFRKGDLVLCDETEGLGHRLCFGEDREGYAGANGGPLEDSEPIPTGWPWEPLNPLATTPSPVLGEPK